MKRRSGMRAPLRRLKAAGTSALEAWNMIDLGRRKAAKEDGWRISELCAALATDWEDLEAVYGKRAMKAVKETKSTAVLA